MKVCLAVTAVLVSFVLPGAQPQAPATLTGIVLDAQGAPIPGVAITILGAHDTPTVITGPDGRFSLGGLASGPRAVRAAVTGFAWRQEALELKAGETAEVRFVLCPSLGRFVSFLAPPPLADLVAEASVVAFLRVTRSVPSDTPCRGEARLEAAVIETVKAPHASLRSLTFVQEQWVEEPTPYPAGTELVVFLTGKDRSRRLYGPLAVFMAQEGVIQPSKFLSAAFNRHVGRRVEDLLAELRATRQGATNGEVPVPMPSAREEVTSLDCACRATIGGWTPPSRP